MRVRPITVMVKPLLQGSKLTIDKSATKQLLDFSTMFFLAEIAKLPPGCRLPVSVNPTRKL